MYTISKLVGAEYIIIIILYLFYKKQSYTCERDTQRGTKERTTYELSVRTNENVVLKCRLSTSSLLTFALYQNAADAPLTISKRTQSFVHRISRSCSNTAAASNLPMPRRTFIKFETAKSSRFLASHRHKIDSVGLGRVAKNVTYRWTFNRSANSRQSLPCVFGGSSNFDKEYNIVWDSRNLDVS